MGRGEDDVVDDVVRLQLRAADAATAAALGLEAAGRDSLDVLRLGHDDDELFVFDQVFDGHLAGVEAICAHARRGELFLDRGHLGLDHAAQLRRVGEDALQLDDASRALGRSRCSRSMRLSRVSWRKRISRMSVGLQLAELERRGHEAGLGCCRVRRWPG